MTIHSAKQIVFWLLLKTLKILTNDDKPACLMQSFLRDIYTVEGLWGNHKYQPHWNELDLT